MYAATIGLRCVLAQDLRDVMVPEPSEEEVMVALAADLASGSLNGRDSGGSLIQIGSSSNFLSECPDSDLIDASAQLGDELSGLRNLLLQAIGGGRLTAAAPGDWNTFYWDAADWQWGVLGEPGWIVLRGCHRVFMMRPMEIIRRMTGLLMAAALTAPLAAEEAATPSQGLGESVKPGINEKVLDPEPKVEDWLKRFEVERGEVFHGRKKVLAACGVEKGMVVIDFERIPGKSREWTLGHVRAGKEVFRKE